MKCTAVTKLNKRCKNKACVLSPKPVCRAHSRHRAHSYALVLAAQEYQNRRKREMEARRRQIPGTTWRYWDEKMPLSLGPWPTVALALFILYYTATSIRFHRKAKTNCTGFMDFRCWMTKWGIMFIGLAGGTYMLARGVNNLIIVGEGGASVLPPRWPNITA
eukprot:jgi/Mesvir1/20161/Mv13400-RA.1